MRVSFAVVRVLAFLFAFLAAASAYPKPSKTTTTVTVTPTPPPNQCNTGSIQCCNSVQQSNSLSGPVELLLELLGIVLSAPTSIGVTCSPITGIGLGGGSECNASPVCCENNTFNGVIAIGCSPININLI